EVAKVVGRDGAELLDPLDGIPGLPRDRVAVIGEELRENVSAVDPDLTHPRQMVQPDLVDEDVLRVDLEHPGERALEPDRDVAETYRAMAGVEKRPRHDADRVREVDDPRVRSRVRADVLGDLEDDRHGPQRLRESAGTRRLLPDAAAREGECLVAQP